MDERERVCVLRMYALELSVVAPEIGQRAVAVRPKAVAHATPCLVHVSLPHAKAGVAASGTPEICLPAEC